MAHAPKVWKCLKIRPYLTVLQWCTEFACNAAIAVMSRWAQEEERSAYPEAESQLKVALEAADRKLRALRALAPVDARLQARCICTTPQVGVMHFTLNMSARPFIWASLKVLSTDASSRFAFLLCSSSQAFNIADTMEGKVGFRAVS